MPSIQRRWDIVLRFADPPLSQQPDRVCRGPQVQVGANPGPGGLVLEGYRGLDDRHAVLVVDEGGHVAIAPVGGSQVRIAPHEGERWEAIPPIRGMVALHPGTALHLGPVGRGVTAIFVRAEAFAWEGGDLQSSVDAQPVTKLRPQGSVPAWFIPTFVMVGVAIVAGVIIQLPQPPPIPPLGPIIQGESAYPSVDPDAADAQIDPALLKGLNQPLHDFVFQPDALAAGWPELESPAQWDARFQRYTEASIAVHSHAWAFWQRLEAVKDDYAFVVTQLREAGLPEVLAGIPYRESQYQADATSYLCAEGWWQFMPEVAHRVHLEVSGCTLTGVADPWSPTAIVVQRHAAYLNPDTHSCRIRRCEVDERQDLQASTRAAVQLLTEAFQDPQLAASGDVVQATILSHNMGYDDARFTGSDHASGVLGAWLNYAAKKGSARAADFYGANLLCTTPGTDPNETCGGFLPRETQHYAYNIVAQHILAVCYYARNYGNEPAFDPWRRYDRGEGYCRKIQVPEAEQVRIRVGPS